MVLDIGIHIDYVLYQMAMEHNNNTTNGVYTMQVFINAYSGDNDFHNIQFIVQANGLDHAIKKAHSVIESYVSGYELNTIKASIYIDCHTIKRVKECRVSVSKRGVFGRVGVRIANGRNGAYGVVHIIGLH